METLLSGITAERVPTSRLTANVLSVASAAPDGQPVLFVHGNVSSSLFWPTTMLALPAAFRPLAVDLRGFGDTEAALRPRRGRHLRGPSRPSCGCAAWTTSSCPIHPCSTWLT
jgi:pimeloyl-ACP methyl ester carboxylesterase